MKKNSAPLPPPQMSHTFGGGEINHNIAYGSSPPKISNTFDSGEINHGIAHGYGQPLGNYHTSALGPRQRARWVWDNRPCSITEFAERAYGDTAQRTQFLLKYSGDEQ